MVSFAVKRVIWIVTTFHRKRCHYPQKRQMVIGYYDKFTIVFLIFKNNCINSLDRAKKSVIIKPEFRTK